MNVHHAPGETGHRPLSARRRYQIEIGGAIIGPEEHRHAAVAPLRDMMRNIRNDDAGKTSHARMLGGVDKFGVINRRA